MTLNLERALGHMSWANQEIYKLIIALPDQALDAHASDPEWTVGEILCHIASASGGYGARLKGIDAETLVRPKTMQELQVIAKQLLSNDAELLELAKATDEKWSSSAKAKLLTGCAQQSLRKQFITQLL